ncbi:uncharacterized protein Dwil_GK11468 [Drosophila willistoni]|uniref:RING-type domain-containing protein n=1 Tax=Drosophila willistoni TaxID=7260 RepID=B4N9Q6_DROWI|nr:E3 ubiquitin-protein ligase Rnf220 [Drosophila willistoni]EDW80621.1 uncharacterized protein Dwil_GK11468 [Drosophila willistoni]
MATETVPNGEKFHLVGGQDEDVICPTCDRKIKRSQVADHCQMEMERLHNVGSGTVTATTNAATTTPPQSGSVSGTGTGTGGRQPWSVFQRVQRNRQARQRQRTRKRPSNTTTAESAGSAPPTVPAVAAAAPTSICPVCNKSFPQSNIQQHTNQCLRQSNGDRHSSEETDDSEEYEEYEWAGQKRIRVSTLVQGGYSSLNMAQTSKYNGSQQNADDEDDEDLNVDEDDTHIYGPTQYGEGDVIPLANEDSDGNVSETDVTSYVRRLISSSETPKTNHSTSENTATTSTAETGEEEEQVEQTTETMDVPSTSRGTRSHAKNQQQIIESLKARLRLYDKQAQAKFKCLICIDDYKNPAISVSCWHVHCEQCWLQTLGARKLCPQCNSITTPKDLRRIYL